MSGSVMGDVVRSKPVLSLLLLLGVGVTTAPAYQQSAAPQDPAQRVADTMRLVDQALQLDRQGKLTLAQENRVNGIVTYIAGGNAKLQLQLLTYQIDREQRQIEKDCRLQDASQSHVPVSSIAAPLTECAPPVPVKYELPVVITKIDPAALQTALEKTCRSGGPDCEKVLKPLAETLDKILPKPLVEASNSPG